VTREEVTGGIQSEVRPRVRREFVMEMSLRSGIGFIELIELIDDSQLDRHLAYKDRIMSIVVPNK